MLHSTIIVLFAMAVGFTASGIAANLYRVVAGERTAGPYRAAFYASMVVAGPNLLCEKAIGAMREKTCSHFAFWLAAAIAGYWSLALGLFVLDIALAL